MHHHPMIFVAILTAFTFPTLALNIPDEQKKGYNLEDTANRCLLLNNDQFLLRKCAEENTQTQLYVTQSGQVQFENKCLEVDLNHSSFVFEVNPKNCDNNSSYQQLTINSDRNLSKNGQCVSADYNGRLIMDHCLASTLTLKILDNDNSQGAGKLNTQDYTRLSFAASKAAYQPQTDKYSQARYLKDGKIQENWTSTKVNFPGRCENGLEKSGELCYPSCKVGYKGVGPVCWQECKTDYTDDGALCRKDNTHLKNSYGRGIGTIPPCYGKQYNAGLCYPQCNAGYKGVGPVCWQGCDNSLTDTGAICQDMNIHIYAKISYGRGAGKAIIIQHYEKVFDTAACANAGWTGHAFSARGQEYIVLRNTHEKISVFSLRGTEMTRFEDIWADIDFTPRTVTFEGQNVWVHSGFMSNFEKISGDIQKELDKTPKDHQVIITGHSLGGAVGTIAAMKFKSWGRAPDHVITFGSPMVGNATFRNMYQKMVGCDKTIRFINEDDLITKIPAVYGYTHVCEPQQASFNKDVLSNHDLFEGYQSVLDSLLGSQESNANIACPIPTEHNIFNPWLDEKKGTPGEYYVYNNTYSNERDFFKLKTAEYGYFPINKTSSSQWKYVGPRNKKEKGSRGILGDIYANNDTANPTYFKLKTSDPYQDFPTNKQNNAHWTYMKLN